MIYNEHQGLNSDEVLASRLKHGSNSLEGKGENRLLKIIKEIVLEPLFIILVCAAIIYFILHQYDEGFIMLGAIIFVSGISLYQENKSQNAIEALKKLSDPRAKVFRNGVLEEITTEEIVVDDLILVEDGDIVPADATIVEAHDLSLNESSLTGEALPVSKSTSEQIFRGSMVNSGSCKALVYAVGNKSKFGEIGSSLTQIQKNKSPLQIQIGSFVRSIVIAGLFVFLIVFGINWAMSKNILTGLLQGLTLAMSILPEEIPVAFSTFMALGAYQLHKQKVIAMSPNTVETLGAATVICVDKTGTITENSMRLSAIYEHKKNCVYDYTKDPIQENEILEYAMWSSETDPFDPMEKSLHLAYSEAFQKDKRKDFRMIHEYPLGGTPPMMTHIYSNENGLQIIAVKGSVEAVISHSKLSQEEKLSIQKQSALFASKGYRVLGVGRSETNLKTWPKTQEEFEFDFLGLLAFYDPPKKNMSEILQKFYAAGINVKMITGDHAETAVAIAKQIQLKNSSVVLSGKEIEEMPADVLREKVKDINIFARMFPDAKLKIIQALKDNGEVVAMTGDGVNDGPALKAAHIGIAMGLRGSEIAKKTASLILMDDDLIHMPDAVAMGRRIYENLKKAIQYIISIHIPIILIVTLPLAFQWKYSSIFSPVHVIFLELIMGPICSIVFEKEPLEKNAMNKPPRQLKESFFSYSELTMSVIQGLIITFSCLSLGYYYMLEGKTIEEVRTVIYAHLIFSNLFLTLVNRSFVFSIIESLKHKNNLLPVFLGVSVIVLLLSIYQPSMRVLFEFSYISSSTFSYCLLYGCLSVIWIEVYKLFIRKKISLTSTK